MRQIKNEPIRVHSLFYTPSPVRRLTFIAQCRFKEIVGTFRMMFFKKPVLLLFLCLLIYLSNAQQVNFVRYTVYDGLVANPVRYIYQDSKGFIWIGTYDGLSRYDGHKFTNYTTVNGLSHNFINSITEVDGNLLIAENNGAIDVIQNNITIKKVHKVASGVNTAGLHNNRLLFSTDANGFFEYKNNSLFSPPQPKFPSSLGHFISLNDTLLLSVGADDDLFLHKNDFSIQASLEYPGIYFYSLMLDSKKRAWACTSSGLKLVQITMGKYPQLSIRPLPAVFDFPPLNNAQVTTMIEEQDGSFWIGTLKGLVRLFPDGNFHVYSEKDGLPSDRINSLYSDKEKNLWIGTSLGLAKWVSRNHVVFVNTETGDSLNDVISISSLGDQKIILETDKGLLDFNFDTKEFKNIQVPGNQFPVPIAGTYPLLIHYGDWIGILDNKKNVIIPVTKLDTVIRGIPSAVGHPQGIVFLGSFNGVYAVHKTSIKKILPYRITSMTVDAGGYIWAGTWSDGLYRITIKNAGKGLYDVLDVTPRMKEKEIRGLYADSKRNLWIGTRYGGAFCFVPKTNGDFDIQHYNRQQGLMSDWVTSFAETKTNDIWVGTYLGLDKLVKESSGYRVFNFSKAVNFFAVIQKIIPAHDRWICAANTGIAVFKDEDLHKAVPLQPLILSSTLGVRENKITIFSPTDKVILKPFQNAARFEFGALGFINERQILYSYRLKGSSDTSWSKPGNIHEATYASLSPGDYTFEVKTIGWNSEEGKPAAFSFVIKKPFWLTTWFIAAVILLMGVLIYLFYRYRINQLLRVQKVRNRIARDLHDDIGSRLTNIQILSALSEQQLDNKVKASLYLHRIVNEVQTSGEALDDIVWSINTGNDSGLELAARMRRYAAEIFEGGQTNFNLQVSNEILETKLPMEKRRDIYLIFKETVNNIHKHAGANQVDIRFSERANKFSLVIVDDGRGFDTGQPTDRNGLKNMKERLEKWGGKLEIISQPGKGSMVKAELPVSFHPPKRGY